MEDADMEAVASLSMAAYGAAGHFDANGAYAHAVADVRGRREHGELLVAEEDGVVIGSVMICAPGSAMAEVSRDGEMEFRFLAVDPHHWGRRIGEELVLACHRIIRDHDVRSIVICVINTNVIAHRFYERLGYERLPERDWQPIPDVDLLCLRKMLD
jgi:ribosomal protein S18 acetylase RimI-like enzyme